MHDRSVNKIITGARNSIKWQSRYLSAGALCHNRRGLSPVARASKTRTRSVLLSPRWLQAYARAVHIFFLLPDFCRSNYPQRKQLHRRMKYFPTSLSLSHPSIPAGRDAKKYFAKTKQRQLFFRMRRYFFGKKGRGKETAAWLRSMYHCQLSREFERQEQLPLELRAFRYRWERKISRIEFERESRKGVTRNG